MVRLFKENDLNSINNLLEIFDYDILKDYKNNPFFRCFLHESDIVDGVLIFEHKYDRLDLNYIVTDSNRLRKGIAQSLMDYLIIYSIKNNIINITLEVNENNNKAISLYKKNGFEIITKRKNYYNNGNALLMIRKFDSDE